MKVFPGLKIQALCNGEGRIWSDSLHPISRSFQFSSVTQFCLTVCDPMDCSMPGFPVHQQLLELTHTHVHRVSDAIQASHPLLSPSPPAFNLSQHQGLFKWVSFSHQVAKVLEFQFRHQSFQWLFRADLLQNGLVGSPCSPRDSSRVFSNTTVQKHQFFGTQPSLLDTYWLTNRCGYRTSGNVV